MASSAFVWLTALPLIASPCIYLIGRIAHRWERKGIPQTAAFLSVAGTWIPLVAAAREFIISGRIIFSVGSIALEMDGLSLLFASLTLVLGTLVVLFSESYMANEVGQEKFFAMLVALIGVMINLACASDLFNLWIWFEAMAVTSYLLVAFYRQQPASLEAGIKYLVQSAAGSACVLIGIGFVLSQTGSLNLHAIHRTAHAAPIFLAAGALFIIGFGVKTALVPLHTWLPDAHSQAPSGISAMLSGVVIEAGLIAMLRCLSALADVSTLWGPILLGFGCLNMLAGNLMALGQRQVKRLLAYSSLAHMGYILLGLGIAFYTRDPAGAQSGFFHLFNHGIMKGLAFLSVGCLLYVLHIAAGKHTPLYVHDLAGAARRYPIPAFALSLAVLSLGGLPPLAGFVSKWQIFVAGFRSDNGAVTLLVAFAALNSVLSLAYYAPLVNAVYRNEPSPAVTAGGRIPKSMNLSLLVLSMLIILIGVWPTLADNLTEPAAQAFLRDVIGQYAIASP